jgi:hypothetical protein
MQFSISRAVAARLLLVLALAAGIPGAGQQFDEYQVKAAFLLNFARFVDWPTEAFANERDPIPVCIWGPDPFGPTLDKAAVQQSISGRPIEIRRITEMRQIAACRVLFARSLAPRRETSIFQERYVLVVSEKGADTAAGAAINFMVDEGRVRFEIDLNPAQKAGLHLSARLLTLATRVKKP